jgi:hypothetical protein
LRSWTSLRRYSGIFRWFGERDLEPFPILLRSDNNETQQARQRREKIVCCTIFAAQIRLRNHGRSSNEDRKSLRRTLVVVQQQQTDRRAPLVRISKVAQGTEDHGEEAESQRHHSQRSARPKKPLNPGCRQCYSGHARIRGEDRSRQEAGSRKRQS